MKLSFRTASADSARWSNGRKRADRRRSRATPEARTPPEARIHKSPSGPSRRTGNTLLAPDLCTKPRTCWSLFAALDAATGKVIGRCYPRHPGREFLGFLREIERSRRSPHHRQLRHPQDASDPEVAGIAAEMACSLQRRPRAPRSIWPSASSPTFTEKQIRRGV